MKSADDITLHPEAPLNDETIRSYFLDVARARVEEANLRNKPIFENVLRQLEALPSCGNTALHAYCTGQSGQQKEVGDFIFPFGVNESQLNAVEQAFTSQISLIEGPPGTGKTQTILNIIANILLRGKTVAIVSNNNAAVENVYEKLGKAELDYLVAKLGNKNKRELFFSEPVHKPSADVHPTLGMEHIKITLQKLKINLRAQNSVAQLRLEIEELDIERRYLLQWQHENQVKLFDDLTKYKLSSIKAVDLMTYLTHLGSDRVKLKNRFTLLFNFKILRTKPFSNWEQRKSVLYGLQLYFYDKALEEKKMALTACEEILERSHFKTLMDELEVCSMRHLKHYLHNNTIEPKSFNEKNYRNNFDAFLRRYPIIGSSTHSIVNSLNKETTLDYVIVDEASQQDIIPGVLALGCAKNLIVVGDRKQLPHIPTKLNIKAPKKYYDCDKYSLLDSFSGIFNNSIPATLLKEHYRCHPKIIQFCNQQFYENQLIPMTQDNGESVLTLIVTAKGNHTRSNTNLREVDSLLATLERSGARAWSGEDGRGFIAPFRAQANLAQAHLPADFVQDTVHKFQGRECEQIVFSTVLDKKLVNQVLLNFVDDPRMVNVAVSRAKNNFTLITGDDVFTARKGHIAALIRYMRYYAEDCQIYHAPVTSAFDLLYREYDHSQERLNLKLRPDDSQFKSEQIVAQILRDVLLKKFFRTIMFHSQVTLHQLVSTTNISFTSREIDFIRNRASCDFVLYFKVGKTPLGVIEVDGGCHNTAQQTKRDELKNSILMKSGIPLLRLQTIESNIEEKIESFLASV